MNFSNDCKSLCRCFRSLGLCISSVSGWYFCPLHTLLLVCTHSLILSACTVILRGRTCALFVYIGSYLTNQQATQRRLAGSIISNQKPKILSELIRHEWPADWSNRTLCKQTMHIYELSVSQYKQISVNAYVQAAKCAVGKNTSQTQKIYRAKCFGLIPRLTFP